MKKLFSGELFKLSGNRNKYQKRFCELINTFLTYRTNESSKETRGTIFIMEYDLKRDPNNIVSQHSIKLIPHTSDLTREYNFYASSLQILDNFIQAYEQAKRGLQATIQKSLTIPEMSGWLERKEDRKIGTKWAKRFCECRLNKMNVYNNDEEAKLIVSIPLNFTIVRPYSHNKGKNSDSYFMFVGSTDEDTHNFRANSASVMYLWVETIYKSKKYSLENPINKNKDKSQSLFLHDKPKKEVLKRSEKSRNFIAFNKFKEKSKHGKTKSMSVQGLDSFDDWVNIDDVNNKNKEETNEKKFQNDKQEIKDQKEIEKSQNVPNPIKNTLIKKKIHKKKPEFLKKNEKKKNELKKEKEKKRKKKKLKPKYSELLSIYNLMNNHEWWENENENEKEDSKEKEDNQENEQDKKKKKPKANLIKFDSFGGNFIEDNEFYSDEEFHKKLKNEEEERIWKEQRRVEQEINLKKKKERRQDKQKDVYLIIKDLIKISPLVYEKQINDNIVNTINKEIEKDEGKENGENEEKKNQKGEEEIEEEEEENGNGNGNENNKDNDHGIENEKEQKQEQEKDQIEMEKENQDQDQDENKNTNNNIGGYCLADLEPMNFQDMIMYNPNNDGLQEKDKKVYTMEDLVKTSIESQKKEINKGKIKLKKNTEKTIESLRENRRTTTNTLMKSELLRKLAFKQKNNDGIENNNASSKPNSNINETGTIKGSNNKETNNMNDEIAKKNQKLSEQFIFDLTSTVSEIQMKYLDDEKIKQGIIKTIRIYGKRKFKVDNKDNNGYMIVKMFTSLFLSNRKTIDQNNESEKVSFYENAVKLNHELMKPSYHFVSKRKAQQISKHDPELFKATSFFLSGLNDSRLIQWLDILSKRDFIQKIYTNESLLYDQEFLSGIVFSLSPLERLHFSLADDYQILLNGYKFGEETPKTNFSKMRIKSSVPLLAEDDDSSSETSDSESTEDEISINKNANKNDDNDSNLKNDNNNNNNSSISINNKNKKNKKSKLENEFQLQKEEELKKSFTHETRFWELYKTCIKLVDYFAKYNNDQKMELGKESANNALKGVIRKELLPNINELLHNGFKRNVFLSATKNHIWTYLNLVVGEKPNKKNKNFESFQDLQSSIKKIESGTLFSAKKSIENYNLKLFGWICDSINNKKLPTYILQLSESKYSIKKFSTTSILNNPSSCQQFSEILSLISKIPLELVIKKAL
ncbi:brwd3 [Anaeramoeba flamelloides]|uniref:Brwd3 n=1 Tax=Anaeramoeba flamelloides TaxID=1746091 RepID=A0ABQ8Y0T5_9EUKA|nr:brwd3 [Anaeramoeba flamelloides]